MTAAAECTRLRSLNLTRRGLTGEIPPQVSSLVQMTVLKIGNNELSGSIPDAICELHKLKVLPTRELRERPPAAA